MINLDVGTVGFSVATVSLALCLVLPRGNDDEAKQTRFRLFFITTACYGIGLLAIVHRGWLPFYWSILGGNLLVMISAVALHAGISVIVKRPPLPLLYIAAVICYVVGQTYYMTVEDNLSARIAVISLSRVPLFAHAAFMLHQARRKEASLGFAMMEGVVVVWTLLLLHRSFNSLVGIDPLVSFVSLSGFQAIYLAAAGLGNVLLVTALYRIDAESMTRGLASSNAELSKANQVLIDEIEQRKNAEKQLQQSKEAAETANAAKSRFLAAASHDLRQPMQAINLFAEALGRTDQSAEQKRISDYISQSTQALGDLLDVLLDISKLDAGVDEPCSEVIQVEALVSKINAEFSPIAARKSLRFKLSFPFRETAVVANGKLLFSLLGNLIGNAIKYTPRGGILIAIRRRGNQALIQVWDTGIGIAPEHMSSIYEEYFQVGNPERDRAKGLGLGLAIVKRIARLLKTEVTCHSRPGKGSVFEFLLPVASTAMAEMPPRHDLPASGAAAGSPPGRYRVVVVDDDLMVATATQLSLESFGMSVIHYRNAEDALAKTEMNNTDFYITDFRLPGLNGFEFLGSIQKRSTRPIKAAVITGDKSVDRIGKTQSSPWPVLFKPVNLSSLLAAIESQEGRREHERL